MNRRKFLTTLGAVASVSSVSWYLIPVNKERQLVSKLSYEYMNDYIPKSFAVCSPPSEEYVGVFPEEPSKFIQVLKEDGFFEFRRSYFHAFKFNNETYYEQGNLIKYYENKKWQMHIRLFEAPENKTYVFAHYEPSVTKQPRKHTSGEYIDTEFAEETMYSNYNIDDEEFVGNLDIDDRC